MNKIFRSIITHPAGFQLELLPRERKLSAAVERCINNPAIAGTYSWEVHELTIMGDSVKLVSGNRESYVPKLAIFDCGTGYPAASPIDPLSKEPV